MKSSKIFVAGHRGMVGSAVVRTLQKHGYTNVITASRAELDLSNQADTRTWIAAHKPAVVVIAAAKVGGILANSTYPWDFIYDNLLIETNLIGACHENDVPQVIFLGSSCIYPKFAEQPISEESLLTASLEPTNEWYAIAKIAGVKMIEALRKQHARNYVSLMPTNLYGPNDNFDLKNSHVLPAMLRKFHTAGPNGTVELWGSGTPMREFLHVDDMAEAVRHAMEHPLKESLYNVGTGSDITIKELAGIIAEVTGFNGTVNWDSTKPDGTPRKLLNVSRLAAEGWSASISLKDGIRDTYQWFIEHLENDTIRS
jgi:GDP-L-fucose synthase